VKSQGEKNASVIGVFDAAFETCPSLAVGLAPDSTEVVT